LLEGTLTIMDMHFIRTQMAYNPKFSLDLDVSRQKRGQEHSLSGIMYISEAGYMPNKEKELKLNASIR